MTCTKPSKCHFDNLYISSNGEARNIKFGQQVNLIQRVQLGTLPQEVMSLPHNQMTLTSLFIPSYRANTVWQIQIWPVKTTP